MEPGTVLYSVGHSTRSSDEIVTLLAAHGIETVVDVRAYPTSRRHPHVNADAMAGWLAEARIRYEHLPALGGRRRPQPGSVNTAWTNRQFQGYADHMAGEEFAAGLSQLLARCRLARTTCLCSEAPWWRCHRRMICDAALVNGATARHIMSPTRVVEHALTPFAVLRDGKLHYPGT